jgi:hypothetical protein
MHDFRLTVVAPRPTENVFDIGVATLLLAHLDDCEFTGFLKEGLKGR